jgi:hypothetical protein
MHLNETGAELFSEDLATKLFENGIEKCVETDLVKQK